MGSRGKNENYGDHHDEALGQVGVHRRDDPAGDTVNHKYRTGKHHAYFEENTSDSRMVGNDIAQDGSRVTLATSLPALEPSDRSCLDRFAGEKSFQIIGQFTGGLVTFRVFFSGS